MEIHPIEAYSIEYDTFAGDVYTLNTASITLTAGSMVIGGTIASGAHTITSATGVNAIHIDSTGNAQILLDAGNGAGAGVIQTHVGGTRYFFEDDGGFSLNSAHLADMLAGTPGDNDVMLWSLDGATGNVTGTGTLTGHTLLTVDNVTIDGATITSSGDLNLTATDDIDIYPGAGNNITLGDNSGNVVQITEAGHLSFVGDATVFNDIDIDLSAARVPAANAPTWTVFIGNLNQYTYSLNDFQEFSGEIDHSYKEGSNIHFHVHGATNGLEGVNKTIKFEIEYEIVDNQTSGDFGDAYTGTTTINAEIIILANTADKTAWVIDVGDDASGNFLQGASFCGRVRRIASTGTEPAADPYVIQIGVHIEEDTVGSNTEITK